MAPHRIKIYNGQIITPYRIIPRGTILITDSTIIGVKEGDIEITCDTEKNAKATI